MRNGNCAGVVGPMLMCLTSHQGRFEKLTLASKLGTRKIFLGSEGRRCDNDHNTH